MFVTTGHLLQGFPTAAVDTPMSAYASGTFCSFSQQRVSKDATEGLRQRFGYKGLACDDAATLMGTQTPVSSPQHSDQKQMVAVAAP